MATEAASSLVNDGPFLVTGGIQTTLVFKHNVPLREFASFEMLFEPEKDAILEQLYMAYADIALNYQMPLILDTETWRTSKNWYNILGTTDDQRSRVHKVAIKHIQRVEKYVHDKSDGKVKTVIFGVMGPMKDAYTADSTLDLDEACKYHREQIQEFKQLRLGGVAAYTLSTSTEAVAIAAEAKRAELPCTISFTVGTDGHLPSGESLKEAVERVDAETDSSVFFFMVNCAHPVYVRKAVRDGAEWTKRIRGVRANASTKSHEELDDSSELDSGNPEEFAKDLMGLRDVLSELVIIGGCCGTDTTHCTEIAKILKAEDGDVKLE